MAQKSLSCPCGGVAYAGCCGRYHGGEIAPDAATLMRSRYSAYVLKLDSYLLETWHASTRPPGLDLTDNTKWLGLEVRKSTLESSDQATVEFVARYKIGGRAHRMHEISHFVRENGRWYYVEGDLRD